MGTFAKGQIVLYPFPYTDLTNRKLRPCLVLSDQMGDDVLLCQMTSKIKKDKYVIELKSKETSLHIDSYVRSNMLFTADSSHIRRKISRIPKARYNDVVAKIVDMIA